MTEAADELEAIRQVNARYCRFLDTKEGMAVSTSGADPAIHVSHTPGITLASATAASGIWAMGRPNHREPKR